MYKTNKKIYIISLLFKICCTEFNLKNKLYFYVLKKIEFVKKICLIEIKKQK